MKTLFLAWQDPDKTRRRWYSIGKLTQAQGRYQFVYTQGALEARSVGFCPLPSFPDLCVTYESTELFALFSNRVLSPSRPDYAEFIQWLSLPEGESDPFAVLARSGGGRATDTLAVFPCPEPGLDGSYHIHLFVHGLSHMPPASAARTESLQSGEDLLLMKDIQNPKEPDALMVRTCDSHLLGYIPQYLIADFTALLGEGVPKSIEVKVERINPSPAPVQFRLLCRVTMPCKQGFQPFTTYEYQAITSAS